MDYLVSKVTLMVTAIALSRGRHYFYTLLVFYVWVLYKLATPAPETFNSDPAIWYWVCASAEVVLIALALIVKPNARSLIIAFSTIQILANTISIYSHALYSMYPIIIRTCEMAQCVTLIIWSPLVINQLERLQNHMKGITWMLKLAKT